MGNDELAHYGVKGMKWGVQNAETQARYSRAKKIGQRFGDSLMSGGKSAAARLAIEAPGLVKAAVAGGAINPAGAAVAVGTAAVIGFGVTEIQKTDMYKRGASRVKNVLGQ